MQTTREGYYTYEEAGKELNRSALTIRQVVYKGVLHPVKFPHDPLKYIPADEVDWFRGKDLTRANAELFQMLKENPIEFDKMTIERAIGVVNDPEKLIPLITLSFIMSLATKSPRKELAHAMTLNLIELLRLDEQGQAMCEELAPELTRLFRDVKETMVGPSSDNQRIRNETLAALFYTDTEEQETSSMPASA